MKTTLEIPDDTFRRAKALAAAQGIPLRQFVTDAVEQKLQRRTPAGQPAWKDLSGGLASLSRETARVNQRIEEAFGNIDEEDQP